MSTLFNLPFFMRKADRVPMFHYLSFLFCEFLFMCLAYFFFFLTIFCLFICETLIRATIYFGVTYC